LISRSSPQENPSVTQFAESSYPSYQPTRTGLPLTRQYAPPSTSLNPPQTRSIDASSSKTPNHKQLLEASFRPHSSFPNTARRSLLDLITQASFLKTHQNEPSIDSADGQALLMNMWDLSDCPPMAFQKSSLSIFALLVDVDSRTCLICGSSKTSLDRAIGCVRSHLDHRPFVCGGASVGCSRCQDYTQ
jgi:hypothetical protein